MKHQNSYHDAGWLVCHPNGRPVHPDTITDRFNKLVDRAGVKRIRLHDVRHYADAWVMRPAVKFPLVEVVEPVLRSA